MSTTKALPSDLPKEFDQDKFYKDVELDLDNVDLAISQLSGKYVYYSFKKYELERQQSTIEIHIKVLEAQLDQQIRKLASEREPPEKLTEGAITAKVRSDTQWQAAHANLIRVSYMTSVLQSVLLGLNMKKEMIVTYCSNRRTELSMDVSLHTDKHLAELHKAKVSSLRKK